MVVYVGVSHDGHEGGWLVLKKSKVVYGWHPQDNEEAQLPSLKIYYDSMITCNARGNNGLVLEIDITDGTVLHFQMSNQSDIQNALGQIENHILRAARRSSRASTKHAKARQVSRDKKPMLALEQKWHSESRDCVESPSTSKEQEEARAAAKRVLEEYDHWETSTSSKHVALDVAIPISAADPNEATREPPLSLVEFTADSADLERVAFSTKQIMYEENPCHTIIFVKDDDFEDEPPLYDVTEEETYVVQQKSSLTRSLHDMKIKICLVCTLFPIIILLSVSFARSARSSS